jgi:adenylyl- and sulfurtransferase ThiI
LQIFELPPLDFKSFTTLAVPTRTGDSTRDEAAIRLLSAQCDDRLKALGIGGRAKIVGGSIEVRGGDPVRAAEVLSKFTGVESASVVRLAAPSLAEASKALTEAGERLVYPGERYRLSVEVEPGLGLSATDVEYASLAKLIDILAERGSKLSDRRPDRTIRALITRSATYVSYLHYPGMGGLPAGVNGKAIVLHSGGVAGYFAAVDTMKAGMELTLLYVYTRETPPANMRRAVATATLLREHHPSKEMELVAVSFDAVQALVEEGLAKDLRPLALHRAMASAASLLAQERGAAWISSGLTSDAGIENMSAYSAEVASNGVTAMFPEASRTSGELWSMVADDRLKAKMPRLAWKLCPASPPSADGSREIVLARAWATGRLPEAVKKSVSGAFRVGLGRGFIDYFACMDSFASKLKTRGTP